MTGPVSSSATGPAASVMDGPAPPATAGPVLPPHPHVFRTEESQP
ncbi:hypothetical protein [Streptomyces sp. ADI98-10]|nr:hypothetical protein [Streptomyces sp. ADI98-10]RPK78661.1 hypothetical protein EES46_33625 [Streptomyces sp. ADI98-10]